MKKNLLLLILNIISVNFYSQNEKPFRENFTLELSVDTLNYYKQEIKKSPYFVKEKMIQIYPSEKVLVEVEIDKDTIANMKVVKENLHPEKTIVIDFNQRKDGRIHRSMMLKVENPFDKKLIYEAGMFVVGHNQWISTSIMPVHKKLMGIELWNDIIITLILSDWRLE